MQCSKYSLRPKKSVVFAMNLDNEAKMTLFLGRRDLLIPWFLKTMRSKHALSSHVVGVLLQAFHNKYKKRQGKKKNNTDLINCLFCLLQG